MGYIYYNYEFKSKEKADQFKYFIENIEVEIKKDYINYFHLTKLVGILKKVFKITPVSLRNKKDSKTMHLKKIAIYLLLNYSKASDEEIIDYFKLDQYTLEKIKTDIDFENTNKDFIDQFFNYLKNGYISNRYQVLCFQDEFASEFDQYLKTL